MREECQMLGPVPTGLTSTHGMITEQHIPLTHSLIFFKTTDHLWMGGSSAFLCCWPTVVLSLQVPVTGPQTSSPHLKIRPWDLPWAVQFL
jgi:hypothetical protein